MHEYTIGKAIFKDYTLTRYIDEGAYGKVYLVKSSIGLPFALKVLHKDVAMEQRGIKSVMQIRSSRLVNIIDYGKTVNDKDCILMEYIQDNLEEVLKKGVVESKLAEHYFIELLKGLQVLESNGIIHRDIKPNNLFILEDIIKIGDFGTARYISEESTKMTSGLGTMHYSAPESFGEQFGCSVDHWSACVVLYRMLCGKLLFDYTTNPRALFRAIQLESPDLSPVPDKYHLFFEKCFQKDVDKRYKDSSDLMAAFERIINQPVEGSVQSQQPNTARQK